MIPFTQGHAFENELTSILSALVCLLNCVQEDKCLVTLVVIHFALQEEQKELDEIMAKRQKKGRNEEENPAEEKTILHGTVTPV